MQRKDQCIVCASEIHMEGSQAVTDSSARFGFYIAAGEDDRVLCDLMQLPLEI